jgi:zinc transport system substrate-binding protein
MRSRIPSLAPLPAALLALAAAACAPGGGANADRPAGERPLVLVSVAPQAWLVKRLAGESVRVGVLLPAATDVETFEPAPSDLRALAAARLYFAVGHPAFLLEARHVEPFLVRHPEIRRVGLASALPASPGAHAAGHAHGDPHLWLSPRIFAAVLVPLATELAALLPEEAEGIAARRAALAATILALDRELTARFSTTAGHRFLIHHPALGTFATDYGLEQRALEQDGREPSPRRLASAITEARHAGARVVLTQRGLSARSAELLAREIGARTMEIDPLAEDWLENLRRIADAVESALHDG